MITLFCMTKRGFICLESIVNTYGKSIIDTVIMSEDNNIEEDYFNEIKDFCETHDIAHSHRRDFKDFKSKYVFAVGWRWLIPTSTQYDIIVFHDSLLPRFRGFAPLVNALIAGEKKIGVTALIAHEKYDAGPIICQFDTEIDYPMKISTAIDLNLKNYILCTLKVVKTIVDKKKIRAIPQNNELATYSLWRDDADYKINWYQEAHFIQKFIDAVGYPYKGAIAFIDNRMLRIVESEMIKDVIVENRGDNIGKIIFYEQLYPIVICGKGLLKIKQAIWDDDKTTALPFKKFRTRVT